MEWVASENVDKKAWDELVLRSGGTIFSLSAYLDATADHWGILYTADRSDGIACSYTVKLGVKTLYAPFFHRYMEWIGANEIPFEQLEKLLQTHFPVADAQLKGDGKHGLVRKHQVILRENYRPNQQVKRMLKKAVNYTVTENFQKENVLALLKKELSPRVAAIDSHSLQLLDKLVTNLGSSQDKLLFQLNLEENGRWLGGIWLLVFNDRILYLKGTVSTTAKSNGGMYRLMEHALKMAFERDFLFDFGGSNVENVRRFNLNWGSFDVGYSHLEWNNAPLWWKMLKSLRKKWNRKLS